MKNIIINLINANQGAHLIRSKNFLLNLKKIDHLNRYFILSENDLNIFHNKFKYKIFKISKNKFISIIQRIFIQHFLIIYYYFKYNISIYINFSHTVPIFSLKKIFKIIAVTNVAPLVKFENFLFSQKIKMFFLKYKILFSCILSNRIISISDYCKVLLEKNNINSKKIFVIKNGINEFTQSRSNNNNKFFLYVSHFYRYKNFENLINSYSKLPKQILDKYKLIIIGNPYDLPYYNFIKRKIVDLNMEKNIEIHSNLSREKIDQYIKECYLFIFPSLIENCPMSILEAIQFNKPILTSNIPPMNEFCKDLPLYFDPHDQNSIMNSIIEFCKNNEISSSYDYSLIKKQLTWEKFTKRILSMYIV